LFDIPLLLISPSSDCNIMWPYLFNPNFISFIVWKIPAAKFETSL